MENVLMQHPDIYEVAVVLLPHENLGETYHTFIVISDGVHTPENEIINFAQKTLPNANFTQQTITFVNELPKTMSGKLLRVELLDLLPF